MELWFFGYRTPMLESLSLNQPKIFPTISIIISACNEEKNLLEAISSIQQIDYPNKEIILINDRSTDNTAALVEQLAQKNNNTKVVHIHTLPDRWMGKNHALMQGAKMATGDWLLFTDADVCFKADSLKRAMCYALQQNLDHLAIMPKTEKMTTWFNITMVLIITMYFLMGKPWRSRYSWSKRSTGQGSFNLIKTAVYHQIGGHEKIRLNSDDDIKLGQLVKSHGYRQDFLCAKESVSVAWYHSLPEMVKGLEKNIFAFLNYNVFLMIFFTLFSALLFYFPLAGILFFHGMAFTLSLLTVLITLIIFSSIAVKFNYPIYYSIFYPITFGIDYYISWKAVYFIIKNKGFYWRNTFYSIADIKSNHLKTKF